MENGFLKCFQGQPLSTYSWNVWDLNNLRKFPRKIALFACNDKNDDRTLKAT